MLLPDIKSVDDYRPIYRKPDTWLPAMRAICERHGLDKIQLEFAPPGTHVVFKVKPDLYIKLFAPPWREDFATERLALHKLSERTDLPIPIPILVAEGEIENWPYIIITAVEGVPLYEVWKSMSMLDRENIVSRCGEFMASIHLTYTEGLEGIAVDWPTFVENQSQDCINKLQQTEIGKQWIDSVIGFMENLPPLFEPDFQQVLLNSDVTDEHVLVSKRGDRWEATGFIDFGDAMLGHPYYEFAAPVCSITHGSKELRRAMLLAYGFSADQLNETLSRQLMAYTLIHRFITIPDLREIFDSQKPRDFEELRKRLWSLG